MRTALCLLLAAWPAAAHVMSMSSGDLTVAGARAHYELRMPLYEIVHVPNPERVLLEHVLFEGARLTHSECRADPARDAYLCVADYEFRAPVDRVAVECTLAAITVPNHVHLLRAQMAGKRDEALFDLAFTRATLRFRPLNALETAVTQAGAGAVRALGGAMQWMFLAALVLAARSPRELLLISATFLLGQFAGAFIMPHLAWQPAPKFVDAAIALTLAYLAFEILLLPEAGARWLVTLVLGLFHALSLHLFLQTTAYSPLLVMLGATLSQLAAIALLSLLLSPLRRLARRLNDHST